MRVEIFEKKLLLLHFLSKTLVAFLHFSITTPTFQYSWLDIRGLKFVPN